MDDNGNVKEICGENLDEDSSTEDVVSPLPILSEIYYIEMLYDHADNKRRKYKGQLHPSFWHNPTKEDIETAFAAGWVALPNDKILEMNRDQDADEAGLRSLKTATSKTEYFEILSDLCCSAEAIMMRGGQRLAYGKNDNVNVCTKFIFGFKKANFRMGSASSAHQQENSCDPCTHDEDKHSCVHHHKHKKQLEKWYKEKKDPCWAVCDPLTPTWGDILGQKWCADRCRAASGVHDVWKNNDEDLKVKIRVWIQPDERIYSSIPPEREMRGGVLHATRCELCGTHCPRDTTRSAARATRGGAVRSGWD
jgi:hypothetical protein